MPPKKELKLDQDRLQLHLGAKVTPTSLKQHIEASVHAQRFQAVVDKESGVCFMRCRNSNKHFSAANPTGQQSSTAARRVRSR